MRNLGQIAWKFHEAQRRARRRQPQRGRRVTSTPRQMNIYRVVISVGAVGPFAPTVFEKSYNNTYIGFEPTDLLVRRL